MLGCAALTPCTCAVCAVQRHHRSRRQLFAGWRLVCQRAALLRMAVTRLMRRTLAGAFQAWRCITRVKQQRRSLLLVSDEGTVRFLKPTWA
jgi:hypothetical protein